MHGPFSPIIVNSSLHGTGWVDLWFLNNMNMFHSRGESQQRYTLLCRRLEVYVYTYTYVWMCVYVVCRGPCRTGKGVKCMMYECWKVYFVVLKMKLEVFQERERVRLRVWLMLCEENLDLVRVKYWMWMWMWVHNISVSYYIMAYGVKLWVFWNAKWKGSFP